MVRRFCDKCGQEIKPLATKEGKRAVQHILDEWKAMERGEWKDK